MTKPVPTNKQDWDRDHFRFAQDPLCWLITANALLDVAAVAYFSAADQAKKHDAAHAAAVEKAEASMARLGHGRAAEQIMEAEPRFLPAFLMFGFAIENLLKGVLVLKDPTLIGDERPGVPRTHDLINLAGRAKIALSQDEKGLLTRLTTITTWSGRYPVSLALATFSKVGIDRERLVRRHADHYADTLRFVDKLKILFPRHPRGGGGVVVVRQGS